MWELYSDNSSKSHLLAYHNHITDHRYSEYSLLLKQSFEHQYGFVETERRPTPFVTAEVRIVVWNGAFGFGEEPLSMTRVDFRKLFAAHQVQSALVGGVHDRPDEPFRNGALLILE